MDPDQLFIETLDDLDRRLQPDASKPDSQDYNALAVAALLRKLLLDGEPLSHRVNRTRHLPIRFEINVAEPYWKRVAGPKPIFYAYGDAIDPDTDPTPGGPIVKSVNLQKFLNTVVAGTDTVEIAAHDVILHAAHIMGGVHLGAAATDKERLMVQLGTFRMMGQMFPLHELMALGRIVSKGLNPLRQRVEALDETTPPTTPSRETR